VAELIDEALRTALAREEERPRIGWYRPSLLPSCLRRQYLIYREGVQIDLEKGGIFQIGELFHDFLRGALRKIDVELEAVEAPIIIAVPHGGDWVWISGRPDGVMKTGDGRRYILEVKSISRLPPEPLRHHVLQVQPYLAALRLSTALVVYLEKRRLGSRIFEVPFSQDLLGEVLRRAVRLHTALKSGEAPKPDPASWECEYCEFKEVCKWSRGKG
jgi:CRISPR-associated protein Cas4